MSEKTVLVVFPSIYSLNKINELAVNISKILKLQNQQFSKIRKNESVIIIEAADPVLASSTVNLLFGIEQIAIAKAAITQVMVATFDTAIAIKSIIAVTNATAGIRG